MTIDEALQQAAAGAARGVVTVPADLHGFPGTAHGGAVAAVFHRLALPRPPVGIRVELLRGRPDRHASRPSHGQQRRHRPAGPPPAATGRSPRPRSAARAWRRRTSLPSGARWALDHPERDEVPGTATCLACGSANPLGLGVRFWMTDRFLWRECVPPATYRTREGAHPALALILLDELGWWLGALAQQECGVTTDVRITLFETLPLGPLLVLGDRAAVGTDEDPRGRYCRTAGALLGPDGTLLASAEVRFAGSRAYTRRLLEPFLATTPPETLARWFPRARALARREPAD